MANNFAARILNDIKEVKEWEEKDNFYLKVQLKNDSIKDLRASIAGPADTPYEGGRFLLDIKIPETYPSSPPKVEFVTTTWHPNISCSKVCLSVLAEDWCSSITLRLIMLSILTLLAHPQFDDPNATHVARQYEHSEEIFQKTAKHYTNVYAGSPHRVEEYDEKVIEITSSLGVDDERARHVLSTRNWNVDEAKQYFE